jgi:glycosyltransferase involved in cell wall biosynthesis
MKILMLAPQPFFEPRGTPISVYQRLKALAALGHQIDLVTYHIGEDIDIPGVTIMRAPRLPFIHEVKVGPSLAKFFLDVMLSLRALGAMITSRYDVIHSHEEAAYLAMVLRAFFGTRHIYDMHSSLPNQLRAFEHTNRSWLVAIFGRLERMALRTSDAIITIGQDLLEHIQDIAPEARVYVIENQPVHANGVERDEGRISSLRARLDLDGHFPVVYTGNMEPYQGMQTLIACAESLRERGLDVVFILVGGKPGQVETLWQQIQSRQLDRMFRLVGTLPPERAAEYLAIGEVLVSPRIEGMSVPLKIYSYLQSGKPVLATRIAAHTKVLSDKTALLVEPQAVGLADGIQRLMQDPDLRRSLGKAAEDFSRSQHDPQSYIAKVEKAYARLGWPRPAIEQPAKMSEQ